MSLRTLRFGDRTISYDAGLDRAVVNTRGVDDETVVANGSNDDSTTGGARARGHDGETHAEGKNRRISSSLD